MGVAAEYQETEVTTMKKNTVAVVAAWILAAASAAFLGSVMSSEPSAHAAARPVQPVEAPVVVEAVNQTAVVEVAPVEIVGQRPKAAARKQPETKAPCQDGETREVGAVWIAKAGSGEGAWGHRSVTLRCF